jgi:hypothetical protein
VGLILVAAHSRLVLIAQEQVCLIFRALWALLLDCQQFVRILSGRLQVTLIQAY